MKIKVQEGTKWELRYMVIAREVSTWSKDTSTKVGSVIVGEKGQIISQGYNGFARGIKDLKERYENRELKYKYIIHSEINSIFNAVHSGASTIGCAIYIHGLPICDKCADAIIQVGIKYVIMDTLPIERWKESNELALEKLTEAGIEYKFIGSNKCEFKHCTDTCTRDIGNCKRTRPACPGTVI